MKIECTIDRLSWILRKKYTLVCRGNLDGSRIISKLSLNMEEKPEEDTIFVGNYPLHCKGLCLQITKRDPGEEGWFLLQGTHSAFEARDDVFHAFLLFHQWREYLSTLYNPEVELFSAINQCAELLDMEIAIVNQETRVGDAKLVYSWIESGKDAPKESGNLMEEIWDQLHLEDNNFDQTYETKGLTYYTCSSYSNCYYENIFWENQYLARILLNIPKNRDDACAFSLAEYMCGCIRKAVLHRYETDFAGRTANALNLCLERILKREPQNPAEVRQALGSIGWHPEDPYEMLWIRSCGYRLAEDELEHYVRKLEAAFPFCRAVQIEDQIGCIHNLKKETMENFSGSLSCFLRENMLKVGISNPFNDFFDACRYGRQAREVLETGHEKEPALWKYEFSSYISEWVLRRCLAAYPEEDFCPPSLRPLKEYDRLHPDAHMLETLFQYVECHFNASLAASRLYVHRTTFFYRMNKIKELTTIRFDSNKEILEIMLYNALLEKQKKKIPGGSKDGWR